MSRVREILGIVFGGVRDGGRGGAVRAALVAVCLAVAVSEFIRMLN